MPARLSAVERIRVRIDELFASDQDLGQVLEQVARLSVRLVMPPGLWGVWGGPAFGQIQPGLTRRPATLRCLRWADNITINGRAIHVMEYQAIIAAFGYAIPGRYWLDAVGNVGVEGGPLLFNIHAIGMAQSGHGWYHSGPGGWTGSDGQSIYYTAPGGETFMTGI